jgi:ABC-type phosphate transport system substrate-binding protein
MYQKRHRSRNTLILLVGLSSILPSAAGAGGEAGKEIAVIVSAKIAATSLSMAELRKIYQGDKPSWPSGQRVTILMPSGAKERDLVLKKVLQMTDTQYKQFWITKVFRAEASGEPRSASSSSAGDLVKSTVGAVACVDAASVPAGVKTLKIDGKAPGEAGYPLE